MRSYHSDVGVEGPLTRSVTWQVSAYNREDRDYPWLPSAYFWVGDGEDDRLVLPSFTTRYESALDGHSRGVELVLQRRSPNGLSGWVAYDLASTKYRHTVTGEAFAGDYDQRHTLNMYGVYRFSDRMSFSARFRAGSNFPVPGYFETRGAGVSAPAGPPPFFFVSNTLNRLRVPVYSRLDVPTDSVCRLVAGVLILAVFDTEAQRHRETHGIQTTKARRHEGSVTASANVASTSWAAVPLCQKFSVRACLKLFSLPLTSSGSRPGHTPIRPRYRHSRPAGRPRCACHRAVW